MIPLLYDENEKEFTSGGLGYLADCTSCVVSEERNGTYECEFSYPCSGPLFNEIRERRYIYATHDDTEDGEPFEIYARSEPIDGIVTFNAHHISYKLSDAVVMPFVASDINAVMNRIGTNLVTRDVFTFETDKTSNVGYKLTIPTLCREMLGGSESSVLDVYGGGEYEFNMFHVMLWDRRGEDTDIEIRYRKNLVDYKHDVDTSEAYNVVVPYWYKEGSEGEPDTVVTLPERYIAYDGVPFFEAVPLDLSDEFKEAPTEDQLRVRARKAMSDVKPWLPSETFEINFAALWQTEEYKYYAPLQRVKLCDTVLVYYPEYGIEAVREKVVKTVYNTLLDRLDDIILNELPTTFSGQLS